MNKRIIQNLFSFLIMVIVFIFIAAETSYLNNKHLFFESIESSEIFFGSLAVLLFMLFFPKSSSRNYIGVITTVLYLFITTIVLFIILTEASIVNFSGKGLGVEVVYHLEWQAIVLGFKEYFFPFCFFVAFLIILLKTQFIINDNFKIKTRLVLFVISCVLLFFYFSSTIIGRVYNGWKEYTEALTISVSSMNDVNQFNHLNVKATALLKNEIIASGGNNKNVIVVYLESFSDLFTTSSNYPDLTPNINKLKTQHLNLTNYYSSAGFTMDGLISSNCGFIPNMAHGNNSLTLGAKPFYLLPCSSDVLNKASYFQEFIGGAKKQFAGKEAFLLDHGFNKVWGWEDFKNQPDYKENHSWWGLHDEDLFSFALDKIDELQGKQPFNLNILTLGTHLKGFSSPSCQKYQQGNSRYLDAIYCTDQLLGKFIHQLKTKGLLKNTVVFITGDHGVFNTSLIHDLFKGKIDTTKLLGIILDGEKKSALSQPLASYDLGSIILELLEIKHNASFIYATGLKVVDKKIIFKRNTYFYDKVWQKPIRNCQNTNSSFKLPLNYCELNSLIKTVYGFTSSFELTTGTEYNQDSSLIIQFSQDELKVSDILLKGDSLLGKTRRDGFILENYLLSRKGVFLILFDNKKHLILNPFNFDTIDSSLRKIDVLLKESNKLNYMFFSNKNIESLKFINKIKEKYQLNCTDSNYCFSSDFVFGDLTISKDIRTL